MQRYGICANYKNEGKNNNIYIHIDGRPKVLGNVVGFINNSHLGRTKKLPNCVLEGGDGNKVMVYAIIVVGKELLIDYNLNIIKETSKYVLQLIFIIYLLCLNMIICNSFKLCIFFIINITSLYMFLIENTINLWIKRYFQIFPICTLEEKTGIYQDITNVFPPNSYYVDCPPYDFHVDSEHILSIIINHG